MADDENGRRFEVHPGGKNMTSQDQLKAFVGRIEKLIEDRKGINADIKEVYDQAASQGFDKRSIRNVIKLRTMASDDRRQLEELVDIYMQAVSDENTQGLLPL